jgi:3-methyladenine DNA glycosylase AlkD
MAAKTKIKSFTLAGARLALRRFADPKKKIFLQKYFKTGRGEYAEGDVFLGVMVPMTQAVARHFCDLDLKSLSKLIASKIHEERLLALCILSRQFDQAVKADLKAASASTQSSGPATLRALTNTKHDLYKFVMRHRMHINNWDLVDTAAPAIIGRMWLESQFLVDQTKLLSSKNLWDRRIAIVGLFPQMRAKQESLLAPTLKRALDFEHDLLHKAAGWLLRDWIKSGSSRAWSFLEAHRLKMPRTMLRYAIEHQPPSERKRLLAKS